MSETTSPKELLSIVVPVHDRPELAARCLDSLAAWSAARQVIVVDDGSRDPGVAALRGRFPDVVWLTHDRPRGFSAAINRGLAAAAGDPILLLNSDAEVAEGGDRALLAALAREPRLGAVAARLRYPDGTPQWSGGAEPTPLWLFALASGLARRGNRSGTKRRSPSGYEGGEVEWAPAAALALRRVAYLAAGPFDEAFLHYAQDLDYAHRLRRRGFSIRVEPGFEVVHHLGGSSSGEAEAGQRLDLLWSDLVRWVMKARGAGAARGARRALLAGAALRRLRLALRPDPAEARRLRCAIAAIDGAPPAVR